MAALKQLAAADELYKKYNTAWSSGKTGICCVGQSNAQFQSEVLQIKTRHCQPLEQACGRRHGKYSHLRLGVSTKEGGSSDAADDSLDERDEEDIDERVATYTAVLTDTDSEALRSQVFQVPPEPGSARRWGCGQICHFLNIAFHTFWRATVRVWNKLQRLG